MSASGRLSLFDVLIDVGGRDRWTGEPDARYRFHPLATSRSSSTRRRPHGGGAHRRARPGREARRGELPL
jgi:hypothetical protein